MMSRRTMLSPPARRLLVNPARTLPTVRISFNDSRRHVSLFPVVQDPRQCDVAPGIQPNESSATSLDELHAVFAGAPLFHRFPQGAVYDTMGWTSFLHNGSRAQAKKYARSYRRPDAIMSDMCADGQNVLDHGAPPGLVAFHEAWGGVSCFIPIGARGRAAWRYAHESIALLHDSPQLACHVTLDPSVSFDPNLEDAAAPLRYVFDRTIGRSWKQLVSQKISRPADRASFPDSELAPAPLAYHVLVTVAQPTSKSQIERIARCEGWDACTLPLTTDASKLNEADDASSIIQKGAGGTDGKGSVSVSPECIRDMQLRNVDRLLDDGLVHMHVPSSLCVEALLYSYLFANHQHYFAGRMDRVLALDGGRCAELLVAAADRAFPNENFGKNDWAHTYVAPITYAARDFLALRDLQG